MLNSCYYSERPDDVKGVMLSVVLDSSHTPAAHYAFSGCFAITNDSGQETWCVWPLIRGRSVYGGCTGSRSGIAYLVRFHFLYHHSLTRPFFFLLKLHLLLNGCWSKWERKRGYYHISLWHWNGMKAMSRVPMIWPNFFWNRKSGRERVEGLDWVPQQPIVFRMSRVSCRL